MGGANIPMNYTMTNYTSNPSKHFLTKEERKLYYLLRRSIPDNVIIMIKPRLTDFIDISHKELRDDYYKVLPMHIDFMLLCYPEMIALLAIELDDQTHFTDIRSYTDKLKNGLLRSSQIPLLRIEVSKYYPLKQLRAIIKFMLTTYTDKYTDSSAYTH